MMSSDGKWTPEPWFIDPLSDSETTAISSNEMAGIFIVQHDEERPWGDPVVEAHIQRMLACVNGCRGLNPEAYRDVVAALEIGRLYASNQFEALDIMGSPDAADVKADLDKIDAALTKATEGNHAE